MEQDKKLLPKECEKCKYKYIDENKIEWCKDHKAESGCVFANQITKFKQQMINENAFK